ncbi:MULTISPECIES: SpoIID/LytB domain-containing protein [Cetobacterium]|uniref:SpoIID/LytB domain-containing protein n=1 Tax=Candidatus Cetobacterium colombiensis TaxID=3073100 RepID=A0ABU4W9X7_9FUSO|nr:SpoIID/LytB domain-containing protein [Candidatus Cetobacterium colombiensis]MDX8336332.1 SpoIID/LytB domain-containing protein [Candidatus Cetobacterium colombiensis]
MKGKKIKKIILSFCFLALIGCSSNSKKEYYERLNKSGHKLSGDRVNLYGKYKKDNLPIAKPIPYLNYVNDMESPKAPFKSYTENEFLAFYKNIKAKGHGDNSSYWRWKVSLTRREMSNILNKNLLTLYARRPKEVLTYSNSEWISKKIPLNPIGDVIEVRVLERGKSGLVTKLLLRGTRGQYMVAKEGNIRNLLGMNKNVVTSTINIYGTKGGSSNYNERPISRNPSMLPSAFIAIEKLGNNGFNIYGGGFGHGSGIPQWSAMDLTKNKGYSYKKVLERYYSNTKLKNIRSIDGIDGKIRVGIMTSGFSTIDHTKISMSSTGSLKIKSKDGSTTVSPNTSVDFITKDGYTQVIVQGKLKLKTRNSVSVTSNRMISITNLKRNIRNYKSPTYRGSFEIRLAKNGTRLNLINEVSIEEYLLQVVPSEMPKSFGLEALKVQAIAARTYAAKDILRNRYAKLGFHILDSTQSQVYNNLDENELATQGVKSTRGMILVHEDKPIDAKYYSTSSGFNSNAHNVW